MQKTLIVFAILSFAGLVGVVGYLIGEKKSAPITPVAAMPQPAPTAPQVQPESKKTTEQITPPKPLPRMISAKPAEAPTEQPWAPWHGGGRPLYVPPAQQAELPSSIPPPNELPPAPHIENQFLSLSAGESVPFPSGYSRVFVRPAAPVEVSCNGQVHEVSTQFECEGSPAIVTISDVRNGSSQGFINVAVTTTDLQ